MASRSIAWQSRLILLLVLPWTAARLVFDMRDWAYNSPRVLLWTCAISSILGLIAWALRSGTVAAACTGALLTASLMLSTARLPYSPLRTGLSAVLTLFLLTALATRFGRSRKERLGIAEKRHGRGSAQVAANVGLAACLALPPVHMWLLDVAHLRWSAGFPFFAIPLAAIAEAAADTISSEVGQVLGGRPLMITTLRRVDAGTDGAITLAGSAAGIGAAALVALAGYVLPGVAFAGVILAWCGAVFGLFFDSLLGATLERKGWFNNDAVNFLSTASAATFSLLIGRFFY